MKQNENGRSMVEMLGVLAIIGILSMTGIYGYALAMRKYRANEIVQTASMLSVMAHAADGGDGDCVELSSTDLVQRPGGVDVEIVADARDTGTPSITINIVGGDSEGICDVIFNIAPNYNCGDVSYSCSD